MASENLKSRSSRIRAYRDTACDLRSRLKLSLVGAVSRASPGGRLSRVASRFFGITWLRPAELHGLGLALDPFDWSETLVFEEIFISGAYDLDRVPFRPSLVVDCGAHIGMFSLRAAARWPGVRQELFEPNPCNIRRIQLQRDRNRLAWQVYEGVVATESGEVALDMPSWNSHAARIHDSASGNAAPALRVPAWSLADHLISVKGQPLVLKLDVEGAERELWAPVLQVLPDDCAIFFETHHGDPGWQAAEAALRAAGFAVEITSDRGQYKDGFALRNRGRQRPHP